VGIRNRFITGVRDVSDLFDVRKEIILVTGESDLDVAIMLATSASRDMTGSVVTVDGGLFLNRGANGLLVSSSLRAERSNP
jgi:hypothetical protein